MRDGRISAKVGDASTAAIDVDLDKWYYASVVWDNSGKLVLKVYDTNGNLVASEETSLALTGKSVKVTKLTAGDVSGDVSVSLDNSVIYGDKLSDADIKQAASSVLDTARKAFIAGKFD